MSADILHPLVLSGLRTRQRAASIMAIALLLLPLLIFGCATLPGGGISGGAFNIVPVSQETEIGRRLSQQVDKTYPPYRNRDVQQYVAYLGSRLVKAYGGPVPFNFNFRVIDDEEVNAFNIPGGYVYVHRGLMAKADNEAELAAVIAHELGHGLARHSTQLMSAQLGVSFILSMLLGPETSRWEQMAADLFTSAGILAYTRSMEREADRLGIYIMYQAGYDPRAAVTFMEKMLALKQREPDALEKLFSSHPPTSERMQNAWAEINRLSLRQALFLNTSRFDQIKQTVVSDPYPKRTKPTRR